MSIASRLALLGLSLLLAGCGEEQPARRGPNLLVVSLDTLRADHLGCYGYERDTSPQLDALAAQGVLFEHVRSHSPKTGPSHMSLFTGLLPDAHGVRNLDVDGNRRLSPNVPTLARLLHEAGWRTAAFHGGGHVSQELGFDDGFERFEGPGGVETNVGRALEAMAGFGDDPFFVFLHTYEIHDPYTPPDAYRQRFVDPDYAGRVTYSRDGLRSAAMGNWEQQHELFWMRVDWTSEADRQQLVDLYDAGIAYADDQLGRLLAGLDALGLADDTLVVVLSDHGEQFREHDDYMHNAVYGEVLSVPLLMRVPPRGLPAVPPAAVSGRRVAQGVQLVDVLPTVLELFGQPLPSHLQGRSLLPLLRGQSLPPADVLSTWPRAHEWALEHEGFKLIRRERDDGTLVQELYELAADPGEQHDVAGTEPERLSELEQRLLSLRELSRAYQQSLEAGEDVQLDEETRRDLQALGYLGGGN